MSDSVTLAIIVACTLFLVITYWWDNRVRGSADKPWFVPGKWAAYAIMSIALYGTLWLVYGRELLAPSFFGVPQWVTVALDFPLTWLCFVFGWGKFFPHGQNYGATGNPIWKEKEFAPAEWIANLIIGKWDKEKPEKWVKNWQTVGMSCRFFLTFGLIKFPYLAFALGNLWILAASPLMLLAGPMYRLNFRTHDAGSVERSEHWIGALLGVATSLALWAKLLKRKDKDNE